MAKKNSTKKKKVKINTYRAKANIEELQASRDGGQIALRGFTYQFLYSCYLILSESDSNTVFHLEGIEDIDKIKHEYSSTKIYHIQLKHSTLKQDASFFKDVMKNFLETYLLEKNHSFKLVYDFPIAKGHMSKLFRCSLDVESTLYWEGIVEKIKIENPLWNWSEFLFKDFIDRLSFDKHEKSTLAEKIEKKLIDMYNITTDNINLFANGIKICCLEKMEQRNSISKHELDALIQNIKDDIDKGAQNPAHSWIRKVSYDIVSTQNDLSYFEGKKPTPQDIVQKLPVRRLLMENAIKESIQNNRVTVIKASSGQGKTTLAFQVACDLQNEYKTYQLIWCNEARDLDNIAQYFRSRVKLGEKPLILIDNLDSQLGEWNRLAQLLQEEISYHYKLLLTTREDDWYSYSGDLSNVKALQVIKLTLNEEEAQNIFNVLGKAQKLHSSISNWRQSWSKVADKKLLIEYIYLLTHGEMLSERIAYQIARINDKDTARITCEILRKICFADICGIKLSVSSLVSNLSETTTRDHSEILKSIENEFLICVNATEKYVEGLHPVRSQHMVDELHAFAEINETALQVVKISDKRYLSKLFANLPKYISNKSDFYSEIVDTLWNNNDLSRYVLALTGTFSGSVMQYFLCNKHTFDNANEHGGLFLLVADLSPSMEFKNFNHKISPLDDWGRITPENSNIQRLRATRDAIPKIVLPETDIYYLGAALFKKMNDSELFGVATADAASYASIVDWLINIDSSFNLTKNISLENVWENKSKYPLDALSSIMYSCFCGNENSYRTFVNKNFSAILAYLKESTQSLKVYTDENKAEIHIEYILLPSDIRKGNEESVSRLKTTCKMLPIYKTYCADSIKPIIETLSGYKIPDYDHKMIPIENLIPMFHQEFNSLWSKTIISHYECDSIFEWLEYWFSIRKNIVTLCQKGVVCICKQLEEKRIDNVAIEIFNLSAEVSKKLNKEYKFPNEDRPFEEKAKIPDGFSDIKKDYFYSIQHFFNQFAGFLPREEACIRMGLVNLNMALSSLEKMQQYFMSMTKNLEIFQKQHLELCTQEEQCLQHLIMTCKYFKEHQPSKYFNKYQIENWCDENNKETMKKARQALQSIPTKHNVIFPEKCYSDGILSFYPIILHHFDMTDGELLINLVYHCTPFAVLDYDFLVAIGKDSQDKIMPTGLQISNDFLRELKILLDTEDVTLAESLTLPLPVEVTAKILACFEHQHGINMPVTSTYEGVDRIAELLWALSISRKELSDSINEEYRKSTENRLKLEIENLLKDIRLRIRQNDSNELYQLCNDVFNGREFNDVNFNTLYNEILIKSVQSM